MKIRIKGNFVRYRLTVTEVQTLADTGVVSETTRFGPDERQQLVYALEARAGIDTLQCSFDGNKITVYLPAEEAKAWPDNPRIGFENDMAVAPGVTLKLLLEKDFVCLDDTAEDQSDNYANPRLEGKEGN